MDIPSQRSYTTPANNSTLLPLLLLSLARQRHTPQGSSRIKTEYDYIVVGAGSAGSVVASRLSEMPCVSVLLLEAGPPPPLLTNVPAFARSGWYTKIDWAYQTAPQRHTGRGLINRQLVYPRGKMLGGSSGLNNMIYVRGNRKNFDDWAAQGALGWSYADVLPYFKKMEDNRDPEFVENGYHGVGGPVTVHQPRYQTEIKNGLIQAGKQIGYEVVDSNNGKQTGLYDHQGTLRGSQRCSTAKAYLVPAENRTNLDILPNAMVRKVLIRKGSAVGVIFDHGDDTYEVRAKKEVILSAGSINTPQILMLSGIGPKRQLQKFNIPVEANLPVGMNLQDHVGPTMDFVMPPNAVGFPEKLSNPVNIARYIYNKTGPLSSTDGDLIQVFSKNAKNQSIDFPDYQIHFSETTPGSIRQYFGLKPEVFQQVYAAYENRSLLTCYTCILQPKSRGRVTLRSNNPYDPPIIDPNYFSDSRDLDIVVEAMKLCKQIGTNKVLRNLGLRPLRSLHPGCEQFARDDDLYFKCKARSVVVTIYHPTSTAKMGDPKDPSTVVDPELRVKNIKNLRVVDASIMPMVTSGNTNAPSIMIGEKASDIIKTTIRCQDRDEKSKSQDRDEDGKSFLDYFERTDELENDENENTTLESSADDDQQQSTEDGNLEMESDQSRDEEQNDEDGNSLMESTESDDEEESNEDENSSMESTESDDNEESNDYKNSSMESTESDDEEQSSADSSSDASHQYNELGLFRNSSDLNSTMDYFTPVLKEGRLIENILNRTSQPKNFIEYFIHNTYPTLKMYQDAYEATKSTQKPSTQTSMSRKLVTSKPMRRHTSSKLINSERFNRIPSNINYFPGKTALEEYIFLKPIPLKQYDSETILLKSLIQNSTLKQKVNGR